MSLLGGSIHYLWLQVCEFAGVCSTCYVEGGHIANAVVLKTASDLQVLKISKEVFFRSISLHDSSKKPSQTLKKNLQDMTTPC